MPGFVSHWQTASGYIMYMNYCNKVESVQIIPKIQYYLNESLKCVHV